jgi:hypothetical protein
MSECFGWMDVGATGKFIRIKDISKKAKKT